MSFSTTLPTLRFMCFWILFYLDCFINKFYGAFLGLFSFLFLDLIFASFVRLQEQTWGGGISWSMWGGKGYSPYTQEVE